VVSSPVPTILTMGFNQRDVAPSARANGGVSLFANPTLRRAFIEAFDRCGALKAALGLRDCNNPNFHTDEHAAPNDSDYDPSVTLPPYNPTDADKLLTHAGYLVVDGVRRYKDGTTPIELTLTLSFGGTPYVDLAKRLQQDYHSNLQITVHIAPEDGDTLLKGAFDIDMWREDVGPDPVNNFGGWGFDRASIPSKQNPNGRNALGLIDPWVVAQYQLAIQTVDGAQRAEVYKGIARHVTEQVDFLPLLVIADIVLVKPTLCNFKKWPMYGGYLWNLADWYLAGGSACP
jgi:ABC-type transport system substrate-binding protein